MPYSWIDQSFSKFFRSIKNAILRLTILKMAYSWIDQSFVLANLSIFYERSLWWLGTKRMERKKGKNRRILSLNGPSRHAWQRKSQLNSCWKIRR